VIQFVGFEFNKVLHNSLSSARICNTLSGGQHVFLSFARSKACPSLLGTTLLANPTSCNSTQLLSSLYTTFFEHGWIPQKLFPQWQVVHSAKHSQVRPRRTMVFGRYRLLQSRQSQQHLCQVGQSQPRGDHCRGLGRKTALSVSFGPCSAVQAGAVAARQNWTFLRLFFQECAHCRQATPIRGKSDHAIGIASCRDRGFDLGGVHPVPQSQLRTTGHAYKAHKACEHQSSPDRKAVCAARVKKNSRNYGPQAIEALKRCQALLQRNVSMKVRHPGP